MRFDSYMICTSPRSGSTLLCSLLAQSGVAGQPDSHFYTPSLPGWTAGLKAPARAPGETETALIRRLLDAAMAKGRGDTGIFGLRQQYPGLRFLCESLSAVYPEAATDRARIESAFGRTLFIHLTRGNKLDQAVSLVRARQSGLWHVASDGSELERTAPDRSPEYDRDAISATVDLLRGYEDGWQDWFARQDMEPLRLSYDALSADPAGTLLLVMRALGIEAPEPGGLRPGLRKLADATSRDWIARYLDETGGAAG